MPRVDWIRVQKSNTIFVSIDFTGVRGPVDDLAKNAGIGSFVHIKNVARREQTTIFIESGAFDSCRDWIAEFLQDCSNTSGEEDGPNDHGSDTIGCPDEGSKPTIWPELSSDKANYAEADDTCHERSASRGKVDRQGDFRSHFQNNLVELHSRVNDQTDHNKRDCG